MFSVKQTPENQECFPGKQIHPNYIFVLTNSSSTSSARDLLFSSSNRCCNLLMVILEIASPPLPTSLTQNPPNQSIAVRPPPHITLQVSKPFQI